MYCIFIQVTNGIGGLAAGGIVPVVPLHVHSQWSLLSAVPSIDAIVDFAVSQHIPALALTDTYSLYGVTEFIKKCLANDIRPIIGAELNYSDGRPFQLLVMDPAGYTNLCTLISSVQGRKDRESSLKKGISMNSLVEHNEGLVLLTGGIDGPLDNFLRYGDIERAEDLLAMWVRIFGRERIFISLEVRDIVDDLPIAQNLNSLANAMGVKCVAVHEVRYIDPKEVHKLRTLQAMNELKKLEDIPLMAGCHFPAEQEMLDKFQWNIPAVHAAEEIADMCRYIPELGKYHFPSLGQEAEERLIRSTYQGARMKYGELSETVRLRIEKELSIITNAGYADYFLIVADIVDYARTAEAPYCPRGSGSSSVVAYCLGIHNLDPIKYDLYFERFLSAERLDPPDIDIDFSSDRRDDIIRYVYEKYGADRVAMVSTFIRLQPRMAFHETAKVYGLSTVRIRALSRHLPMFYFHETPESKDKRKTEADILDHVRDEKEREAVLMARSLEGVPHHLSVHPGGIVISPVPLVNYVPLQFARKGILITQFDLTGIAAIGLIKIDLLGVSSLTVASRCIKLIQKHDPSFSLASIPFTDETTEKMIAKAETIGIFQIESPGLRLTLREMKARTKDDLIIAICLYRPGPLKGGLKEAFIRRHRKAEEAEYLHPALIPVLKETYGVILYQEQVIRIAHEVGGFSLGRADALRKAISRFKHVHLIKGMQEEFIEGARKKHAIERPVAEKIWKLMEAFAGYGFPKAHAAAYGELAFKIAYIKAHYPFEFMASRIAVPGGYYSQHFYMAEARRLGIIIKPPNVNHSRYVCNLVPPATLYAGLFMVRNLTYKTARRIVKRQPYSSIDDFLTRAHPLYKEAQYLLRANCFDGVSPFGVIRENLEMFRWKGNHTSQSQFIFDVEERQSNDTRSDAERLKDELFLMKYSFSKHYLEFLPKDGMNIIASSEIGRYYSSEISIRGIPRASHKVVTKSGKWQLLIDCEDEYGIYQVLWNMPRKGENARPITRRSILLIHGKVYKTPHDSYVIIARTIAEIHRPSRMA